MNEPADRDEALERIAALAETHGLSSGEILQRLEGGDGAPRAGNDRLIRRILAYLGAIFILAGAVTAVNLFWAELGSAARVAASFGPGLVALILAIATVKDRRYEAATTPLFLVAGLLQTAGLFVLLDEYTSGGDPALGAMAVFGVMALQSIALLVSVRRTTQAFLSVLFGSAFFAAACSWLDVDGGLAAVVLGVSGLLVSWRIDSTPYRAFTPLAFFAYGLCVAVGAFDLLEGSFPIDFALIGVAGVLVYAGVLAHSRSLLFAGVLAMLGYLGYYTGEYFADMLSWPVALIVIGFVMLGLSSYAVRLGRGMQTRD